MYQSAVFFMFRTKERNVNFSPTPRFIYFILSALFHYSLQFLVALFADKSNNNALLFSVFYLNLYVSLQFPTENGKVPNCEFDGGII